MIPFLSISLMFIKSEISAGFFFRNGGLFWGFVSDIVQVNFLSSYCFIWLYAKKVKTRNFSSFFSAFRFFVQNRKTSTFFRFICSASLIDSCQNWIVAFSRLRYFARFVDWWPSSGLHLNLAPCFIMHYGVFNVIRSQVKEAEHTRSSAIYSSQIFRK